MHPRVIQGRRVCHTRPIQKGGSALLLSNKDYEYPIRGLPKDKMVSMSGGSIIRTQPVRRPIKIML